MPTIKQHRPAFVDGPPLESVEFYAIEELFDIPWVRAFATAPHFIRFSFDTENRLLMAEFPAASWVVGFLNIPLKCLPEWEPR